MAKVKVRSEGIYRILDANLNRAAEGLRVCEEVSRFILNDKISSFRLKSIRHKINKDLKSLLGTAADLVGARDSKGDVGRTIHSREMERNGLQDVFFANIQRVKESIRVLEEFSKLLGRKQSLNFKKVRYEIYGIEKSIAKKMQALRDRR